MATRIIFKFSNFQIFRKNKKYLLTIGVICLAGLAIVSFFLPKNQLRQTKEALVQNPHQLENYLALADQLIEHRQFEQAGKILQEAEALEKNQELRIKNQEKILGETTILNLEKLQQKKINSNPEEIQKLIGWWQEFLAEKPDYRDGYLHLAKLHWQLYQDDQAQTNLQKALELDPNYEPARELEKLLSQTGS